MRPAPAPQARAPPRRRTLLGGREHRAPDEPHEAGNRADPHGDHHVGEAAAEDGHDRHGEQDAREGQHHVHHAHDRHRPATRRSSRTRSPESAPIGGADAHRDESGGVSDSRPPKTIPAEEVAAVAVGAERMPGARTEQPRRPVGSSGWGRSRRPAARKRPWRPMPRRARRPVRAPPGALRAPPVAGQVRRRAWALGLWPVLAVLSVEGGRCWPLTPSPPTSPFPVQANGSADRASTYEEVHQKVRRGRRTPPRRGCRALDHREVLVLDHRSPAA